MLKWFAPWLSDSWSNAVSLERARLIRVTLPKLDYPMPRLFPTLILLLTVHPNLLTSKPLKRYRTWYASNRINLYASNRIEFGFSEWWFIARDMLSNRVGKVNWLLRWKLEGWIEELIGHWVIVVDSLSVVWFMLVDFTLLCIPTNFKRISNALVRSTFGNSNTLVFHSVIVRIINVEALTYETETRIY